MKRSEVVTSISAARRQTAVVERKDMLGSIEWWAMLPDGSVSVVDTASAALAEIQKAASRGNRGVTITTIEWRGVPDGWTPPKGDRR